MTFPSQYEIVKVSENEFDVLIFSSNAVLKSFRDIYPESVYVEKSNFDRPVIIFPNFESLQVAEIFGEYWMEALRNPKGSCKSCPTVQKFFSSVASYISATNESTGKDQ